MEVLQHVEHADPFEFDQEFFAVGHSGGSQSRGSRGTRGSRGNNGYRGKQEGDQAQAVPLVYNPARATTISYTSRHQDHIALHVMYLRLRIVMNDGD